jgi:hypothetical protein
MELLRETPYRNIHLEDYETYGGWIIGKVGLWWQVDGASCSSITATVT